MLLKIKEITTEDREVDVALPVYSRHDLDHSTIYFKLDAAPEKGRLMWFEINISEDFEDGKNVQLSARTISTTLGRDTDYYLGRGIYKSSEEDWNTAMAEARKLVAKFGIAG